MEGKFVQANEYGKASSEDEVQIELTEEEKAMVLQMRQVWNEILKIEIADDTDFFATGAGSMDVVRLVEEVKDKTGVLASVDNFHQLITSINFNRHHH